MAIFIVALITMAFAFLPFNILVQVTIIFLCLIELW